MTTVTLLGEYRDLLFYGFLFGLFYVVLFLHNYIEYERSSFQFGKTEKSEKSVDQYS
jgi:hypothetical protein